MKFAKATKFHRKSGGGLGHRFRNIVRAPEARHPECWLCRASSAPQSWRSVSQPFRAGLMFGYRPYGPGSDLRFIAGYHTPSKARRILHLRHG
jgi:hypothetical protein